MSIDHYPRKSPFEISELAQFDKNIEFDSLDEKRRKRIAYLRQAMNEVEQGMSMMKSMGCFFLPFYIIPIFWPFLIFMHTMKKRARNILDAQLDDALRYWDIQPSELGRPRD